MPKRLITTSGYKELIAAVRAALSSGLLAAQRALEYERLRTYWRIGREIRRAVERSRGELRLSQDLYLRLSRDLEKRTGLHLTVDTITRMVQFSKNYPAFPEKTRLTFTHYIALQRVRDPKLRLQLESRAACDHWTVADVKQRAAELCAGPESRQNKGTKRLAVPRGEPYVYSMRPETRADGSRVFRIDCGFKISFDLPEDHAFVPVSRRTVRSVKKDGRYHIRLSRKSSGKLYTYAAVITRAVDGDTVDARIDAGFGIGLYERLRLKGINAPEARTLAGQRTKRFLEAYFVRRPVVIVRTSKAGMYGRWLADVFALRDCEDPVRIAAHGEYVNQLLLDKGLAELY